MRDGKVKTSNDLFDCRVLFPLRLRQRASKHYRYDRCQQLSIPGVEPETIPAEWFRTPGTTAEQGAG